MTEAATVTRTGDRDVIDPDEVPPRIGRYRVVERIGAGGMGVVLAAVDPELDRTVAIKLVRPRPGDDHETGQQRLRREAQALARLAHPNVVSIYDVVVDANRIGVVMQHIDGLDLRRWLAEAPRRTHEIIARFVDAGRGLAAAHAAGVVHRDFKPSNVLVDRDGATRVTDFGLARLLEVTACEITSDAVITDLASTLSCGAVVGTPCYMAPEQFLAGEITPATDQFAFCASLWEALAGERPFAGNTFAELRASATSGRLRSPPPRMPRHVLRALRRGLSVAAADRFTDMTALLAAIAPRSRLAWLAVGTAVAALAAGALVVTTAGDDAAPCANTTAPLDAMWTTQRRDTLLRSLGAIAHPRSADLARRATAALDEEATRWRASAIGACEAKARGGQAANVVAARDRCLSRSVADLDAKATELERITTPQALVHALSIARTGRAPDSCADPNVPAGSTPIAPPALIERVAALDAAWRAGRIEQVLADGPALAAEVDASGDPALQQDVWWVLAAAADTSTTKVARDANRRAAEAATAAGDDLAAVAAWSQAAATAANAGKFDAVDDILAMARASAARSGDASAKQIIEIGEAEVAIEKRGYDAAIATCRRLLEPPASGPMTELRQRAHNCLTTALERKRDWTGLEAAASALLDELAKTLGRDHPRALAAITDLAAARFMLGDKRGARALWAEVDAGLAVAHGADSLQQMRLLFNIATFEGDYDRRLTPEATAATKRAMAIARARLPVEDPQRGQVAWGYANLMVTLGDDAAAATAYAEAMQAFVERDNPEIWARLVTTASAVDVRAGRCTDVLVHVERVLALHAAGKVSKAAAGVAHGLRGSCLAAAGKVDAGLAELNQAARDVEQEGETSYAIDFELDAATLEAKRGRKDVARKLAATARARITGDSDQERKQRARADQLLAVP